MPLKEVCDLVPEPVKMLPAQHRGLRRCDQVTNVETGDYSGIPGNPMPSHGSSQRAAGGPESESDQKTP